MNDEPKPKPEPFARVTVSWRPAETSDKEHVRALAERVRREHVRRAELAKPKR